VLVLVAIGCATTTPVPKTVTHIKQLAGVWEGWIGCRGCPERFRSTLTVQDDGSYRMVNERNTMRYGRLGIVNGVLQHGVDGWWHGEAKLVEERGREWLTLYRLNGDVYVEYYREQ
jgi:hypothetical protein